MIRSQSHKKLAALTVGGVILAMTALSIARADDAPKTDNEAYGDAFYAQLTAQKAEECISEDAPKEDDGDLADSRYISRVQSCINETLAEDENLDPNDCSRGLDEANQEQCDVPSIVEYEPCTDDKYCYAEYSIAKDEQNTACLSDQSLSNQKLSSLAFLDCLIEL